MREKCDNVIRINIFTDGKYVSIPYDCEKFKGHKGNHMKAGDAYKVEWERDWNTRNPINPRPLELNDVATNRSLNYNDRKSLYNNEELAKLPENLFKE